MFTKFITVYLISLCLFFVCTLRVRLIKSKLISLFFNLWKINVGHMLNSKRHLRGFSRFMIGLFAVQVLAAGFCLVTPEVHAAKAHAMDMQMPMSDDMASHCESNVKAESDHAGHSACAHCDLPDELVTSKVSGFDMDFELPAQALVAAAIEFSASLSTDFSVRTPTGPPRSSSLLYTTTQRILV
jgi:hypothetical protein